MPWICSYVMMSLLNLHAWTTATYRREYCSNGTVNKQDDAHGDIYECSWVPRLPTECLFYVRVFHPNV